MRNKRELRNSNKLKLKNSTRYLVMCISLVVFAFSSAGIYKNLNSSNITKVENELYTYENNYKIDYSVNIQDNPFIIEDSLPPGKTYIADLIESLNTTINYTYSGSQSSLIKYDYKIDAVIGASYTDDGTEYSVWNKTYNLKTVDSQESNDIVHIEENLDIDYPKYHQEVKDFKQTLGMLVDSFLYIRLTVNTTTLINEQEVKNEYVSKFSITLGEKIANVEGEKEDKKSNSIKQSNTIEENNVSLAKIIFNLIVMMVSIYVMYFVKFKTKKYNTVRNEYRLELNRILKSCQDRIVTVKNQFEENDPENIIDVNDFGELIKLSEELYKPILCWISDDITNEQAWFSVISNKIKYRYILKK